MGAGPPVIVLHGLFGSGTNWGAVARNLARDHRVVLPDLRNHGGSPHTSAMDYGGMAGDVAALLDRLGLDEVAMVGHSMGGKVAMTLAIEAPQRVGRLVVVDIAPVEYRHDQMGIVRALREVDLSRLSRRDEADAALARHLGDERLRGFLLQNLVRHGDAFRWRLNLEAIARSMDELMGFAPPPRPYLGPTLFLAGDRSDYVLREHRTAIRSYFPLGRVETVRGAGHWLHVERPEDFVAHLRTFLAEG